MHCCVDRIVPKLDKCSRMVYPFLPIFNQMPLNTFVLGPYRAYDSMWNALMACTAKTFAVEKKCKPRTLTLQNFLKSQILVYYSIHWPETLLGHKPPSR